MMNWWGWSPNCLFFVDVCCPSLVTPPVGLKICGINFTEEVLLGMYVSSLCLIGDRLSVPGVAQQIKRKTSIGPERAES